MVIIFKVAQICSQLPFSKIYLSTPDLWMVILYYVIIAGIIYLFYKNKIRFLRFILSHQISQMLKKYRKKIMAFLVVSVLLFKMFALIPRDLKVYFVDVGQRRLYGYSKFNGKKYCDRWRK